MAYLLCQLVHATFVLRDGWEPEHSLWMLGVSGSINQSINFIVCLGTYAQIHQTIYMFSAEWKTSHSWHSCKKCATLTGGLRVIRSDTESASLNRSAKSNLATSYFGQSNMA